MHMEPLLSQHLPLPPGPRCPLWVEGWGEGIKLSQPADLNSPNLAFYPKGHKSRREKERKIYTAVLHLMSTYLDTAKEFRPIIALLQFNLL
jgi:hypothetical protein